MKTQEMVVIRLETPVPCGFPDCEAQTQDTIYESHAVGRYRAIELAPYCPKHKRQMRRLWKQRYGG